MNKVDIETYFRIEEELKNRVCDVANLVNLNERNYKDRDDLIELTEGDGDIYAHFEHQATCGCCGPDYSDITFPTKLIYGEDWEDKALAFRKEKEEERNKELEENKKKKEKLRKKSIEAGKKIREEYDKAEYIRLKAKFESD